MGGVAVIDPTLGSLSELVIPVHICLNRLGWIQGLGGILIAVSTLLFSYDHISLLAGIFQVPQEWCFWLIVALVALVVIDAEWLLYVAVGRNMGGVERISKGHMRFPRSAPCLQRFVSM